MAELHQFRLDPEYSILSVGKGLYSEGKQVASDVGVFKTTGLVLGGALGIATVAPVAAASLWGLGIGIGIQCAAIGVSLAKAWLPRICGEKL